MMLFTLGSFVQGLIDAFKARVLAFPGTFEAESCLKTQLDDVNNINLLQDATIVITPNGVNEGILHTVKGNTITTPYNLAVFTESVGMVSASVGLNNQFNVTESNPFGVNRATRYVSNASAGGHRFTTLLLFPNINTTFTFSAYLKKGIGTTAPDVMQLIVQRGGVNDVFANFNIVTGVIGTTGNCTATINNIGIAAGWWRCSITFTSTLAFNTGVAFCNNNISATVASPSYVDALTSDIYVVGLQIEAGSTATTYQPILFTQLLERGYLEHTRSTTGYKVDSDGSVNETPQANLIPNSEAFNSWSNINGSVIINNEIAPNGTPTADSILITGISYRTQLVATTYYATTPIDNYVYSIYVKPINTTVFIMGRESSFTVNRANFSLIGGGTVTSAVGCTATITLETNGFYRCAIYYTAVSLANPMMQNGTAVGTVGVALWGAMVTRGTTLTPYYPSSLRTNTPRLDYTDGSCPTILIEGAATNRILRSSEFDNASWVKSNLTTTLNTEIAPNGLLEADTLTATANGGWVRQNVAGSFVISIFSVYLKRKTGTGNITLETGNQSSIVSINSSTWTRVWLLNRNNNGTYSVTSGVYTITTVLPHNLTTGDQVSIDCVGGGGADHTGVVTVTGANTFTTTFGAVTTGGANANVYAAFGRIIFQTSGDEVYAWGAQLETPSNTFINNYYEPTSYIPTTTATATRGADSLNLYKIRENNLLNNTFSLFWEVKKIGGSTNVATFHLALTDTINSIGANSIYIGGVPLLAAKRDNGVSTSILSNTVYQPLATNYYKGLLTCNNGIIELWIDGSKLSSTTFVNYDKLLLLNLACFADNGIARFKQVFGWNRVLSSAELDLLFAYPYFNAGYTPVNNELQQVVNRANAEGFTIPSTTILGHCDTLITAMKNDGAWNLTDAYFNFAYNNINLSNWSRINWKNPYGGLGIATLVGAGITYQTNGFKSNGTGSFIRTNFNPAIAGFNFTLNNAGTMITVSQIGTSADTSFAYVYFTNSGGWEFRASIINPFLSVNTSTFWQFPGGTTNRIIGTKALMRDNSTNVRRVESATVFTNTITANSFTNNNITIWNNSNPGNDSCVSQFWVGASLTNSQIQNFRTYYNTYLTSIGLTAFA